MIYLEETPSKPVSMRHIGAETSLRVTGKQFDLLSIVVDGDGRDGNGNLLPVDLDQILERLAHQTSKPAVQFIIRTLIEKGLMRKGETELRRSARRRVYHATDIGRAIVGGSDSHFVETEYL